MGMTYYSDGEYVRPTDEPKIPETIPRRGLVHDLLDFWAERPDQAPNPLPGVIQVMKTEAEQAE